MGMGLTGSPHTYAMLKDITFGPIPSPCPEISVHKAVAKYSDDVLDFCYFFDDDYGAADTFDSLYSFLSEWYFPRMSWALLTLKPSKAFFMVSAIEPLGLSIGPHVFQDGTVHTGVKASMSKLVKLRDYPVPKSAEEVEAFLYMTLYLKIFIPGRVEHACVLKQACISEMVEEQEDKIREREGVKKGRKGIKKNNKRKVAVGFEWRDEQQKSFEAIKEAVVWNACFGSDPQRRHYLSTDVSPYGFGGIFFQLDAEEERKMSNTKKSPHFTKGKERVIHYISQRFNDAETRYPILEREALAVLRSLEDVRWLAVSSRFPIIVYTHQAALLTLLRGDDTKGRMAGWQVRLSEYNIEVRQTRNGEVNFATGLSRMPYEIMDEPTCQNKEWADIAHLRSTTELQCRIEEITDEYDVTRKLNKEQEEIKARKTKQEIVEGGEVEGNWGKNREFVSLTDVDEKLMYIPRLGILVGGTGLLIYCDGLCQANGTERARATVGIYLGPDYMRNTGEPVPPSLPQTNQVAELWAVARALEIGEQIIRKERLTRLIIASDSAYVCKGLTHWIQEWKERLYRSIHNADLFQALDGVLETLEKTGILVQLWKIPRQYNGPADSLANQVQDEYLREEEMDAEVFNIKEVENEGLWERWKEFLEDLWYGEMVEYKLTGCLRKGSSKRSRKVKMEASKMILIDDEKSVRLGRYEGNNALAECIREFQVEGILHRFHDLHGHFAAGVMSRNMVGKFYWPGCFKDIANWCRTCDACQRLGPLQPSAKLSPIMQLQPMDMLGMDFIGPFNPQSEGNGKYIIIGVDYFSWYCWARVTTTNHGHIVESFLEKDIVRMFGWPLAVYLDNGSHFVKGVLPGILQRNGVKLFSAPITHPRSVGLSERYVQMILAGL